MIAKDVKDVFTIQHPDCRVMIQVPSKVEDHFGGRLVEVSSIKRIIHEGDVTFVFVIADQA